MSVRRIAAELQFSPPGSEARGVYADIEIWTEVRRRDNGGRRSVSKDSLAIMSLVAPKGAAEHALKSREPHFEDDVNGCAPEENRSKEGQGSPPECDAKCAYIATRIATPQPSAFGRTEPQETTESAATIQVAVGSSGLAPAAKTGPRQDAAKKTARRGHGWPGGREESGGDRIRTCDLEVMSLASYRAAPPRDMFFAESESGSHPKRTMTIASDPFRDVSPTTESE